MRFRIGITWKFCPNIPYNVFEFGPFSAKTTQPDVSKEKTTKNSVKTITTIIASQYFVQNQPFWAKRCGKVW